MVRSRSLSPAAERLLLALAEADGWTHGYALSRSAGIQSGTLYPLLVRLEGRGLLDAEWQPAGEAGRPPRHAYRLTATGRQLAAEVQAQRATAAGHPA